MIEKESAHFEIILHDHPEPPRLLVIPKKKLKRFLIVVPILIAIVFCIMAIFIWINLPTTPFKMSIPKLPTVTKLDDTKVQELEAEIKSLKDAQQSMQTKLAQSTVNDVEIWLGPVKKPYALQDLTAKNVLKLESITLESEATKRVLRFNLINNGPESERVTGHIFVFQIDSRGQTPYPAMTKEEWLQGIRYNKGESFAVSRLRPVEAPFPPADSDAKFLVLIFNREGDLLVRQEMTGPFKNVGQ
ncbi:MAG: hypothetical protein K2P81_02605 [Bacteriovoracaceae bacterium]|nr:hypothetical protein [Bacteriovoracaceae bacterium]